MIPFVRLLFFIYFVLLLLEILETGTSTEEFFKQTWFGSGARLSLNIGEC